MKYDEVIKRYNARVSELAGRYESVSFEDVHPGLCALLDSLRSGPEEARSALDIGAGSGRDAAWLARQGFEVVAVEPAPEFVAAGQRIHGQESIRWVRDSLPDLTRTIRPGLSFDLVLLSGVWMHVAPDDRPRVFRKLVSLLKPGGFLSISLRKGPHHIPDSIYPVSSLELEKLSIQRGLVVVSKDTTPDRLNRPDVAWETVIMRLPNDGTGALPLLRHIIARDRKSSTYKLALLRCILRIADSAGGLARFDDELVSVPLGLVALYWIRMFKPLLESDIPQSPDKRGLGFVKEPFRGLKDVSAFELKVGAVFAGPAAASIHGALKDAARTIRNMPANYITYPNSSERIFKARGGGRSSTPRAGLEIVDDYLRSFGELLVPLPIWNALSRYSHWIEPSLLFEWSELMQGYACDRGKSIDLESLMSALRWQDEERDTQFVRSLVHESLSNGDDIRCVWSGKSIRNDFAVDHCFPFSAWPCNDLWNLMPARSKINLEKSDRLVTSARLSEARGLIETWWQTGYFRETPVSYAERFRREALASLPLLDDNGAFFESMFEAMQLKRQAIKLNQNLQDWESRK